MRDRRVDILRFIGLAMIILAHVSPPPLLFQLRNFDVPLMVLLSAISYGLSYKATETYPMYFWKRIKRLVFPVWLFLTFYFIFLMVVDPAHKDLNPERMITSYTLTGGIGYVWIIRVFLLVALTSPLIHILHKAVKSDRYYPGFPI